MDLFDIIITILILGAGSLLGSKKRIGKNSAPREKEAGKSQSRPSLGDIIAEMFGETPVVKPVQKPAQKPVAEPLKSQVRKEQVSPKQEYFSYENQPIDWTSKVDTQSSKVFDSMINSKEDVMFEPLFSGKLDLRSAFIYQTILENKYITY